VPDGIKLGGEVQPRDRITRKGDIQTSRSGNGQIKATGRINPRFKYDRIPTVLRKELATSRARWLDF